MTKPTVIYPEKKQATIEDIRKLENELATIKQTLDINGRNLADLNQKFNMSSQNYINDTKPFYLSKINISSMIAFISLIVSILELNQLTNLFPQEAIPYLLAISATLNLIIGFLRTFETSHKELTLN